MTAVSNTTVICCPKRRRKNWAEDSPWGCSVNCSWDQFGAHGEPGEGQRRPAARAERRASHAAAPRPCAQHHSACAGPRRGAAHRVPMGCARRSAPYTAARLTRRARGRAGRQNAGNAPVHPTSPCSPQSALGGPRHVGCSGVLSGGLVHSCAIDAEAHKTRTRARRASKHGQCSCASNEHMFAAIGARGAAPRRLQWWERDGRRADVHCTADCPGDAPKGHACAGVDQQRVGDGLCR